MAVSSICFLTGANFSLSFPFGDRPPLFDKFELKENVDLIYYNNPDDYFSEVHFVVESEDFKLKPSKHQAARLKPDGTTVKTVINHYEHNSGSTMSARWVKVLPGEKIVLFYSL